MQIRITRIDPSLPLPEYHTPDAAAFDMYARVETVIAPQAIARIPSNLILQLPKDHALIVASRSGTPKLGISPPHGIGIIDEDFSGPENEILIQVFNFTDQPVTVGRGDRIAQGLIVPVVKAEFVEAPPNRKDSRGSFGSTGI